MSKVENVEKIIEAYGPGGQEKSRCPTGSRGLRELRPLSATGVRGTSSLGCPRDLRLKEPLSRASRPGVEVKDRRSPSSERLAYFLLKFVSPLRELANAADICTGRVREAKETPRWIQMAALHEGVEASLNGLAQWHDQRSVNIGKICSKTLFHERG